MTTTPTPAEIEAFRKGLELVLIVDRCVNPDCPFPIDILAMEGLAVRVIRKAGKELPGTETEFLPALVAAVEEMKQ